MHTFDDEIDVAGDWWIPEKQDSKKSGQLKFDRVRGVELQLIESFTSPHGSFRLDDKTPQYPIIHGVTAKGQAVTLIDAQQLGRSISFGSGGLRHPEKIHARTLLIGDHLSPGSTFHSMSFTVPALEVWLGKATVAFAHQLKENQQVRGMSYELSLPEKLEFRIFSICASISFYYGFSSKAEPYKSIDVNVIAGFTLEPDDPQSIEWFIENQNIVLSMISLLAGQTLLANCIAAQPLDSTRHDLELLFAMQPSSKVIYHTPADFFLSPPAITIDVESYCNAWFELTFKAQKPIQLARSIMASENLWLHMEFLSLMQALEGLHRALFEGDYMNRDKYNSVAQVLMNAIPGEVENAHRDSLLSRIKYGNQLSLRNRLKHLVEMLPLSIREHVCGDHNGIPSSWIDTRNYYTHWDDELANNIVSDQGMYNVTVRLRHLIRALYAQLMGIPAANIQAAFESSSRAAQQLIQLNIMERRISDPKYQSQPIMTISETANADVVADESSFEDSVGGENKSV